MGLLLKIFPAGDGDCFVCEFDVDGKPFRLMVDGGVSKTYEKQTKTWLKNLNGDVDLAVVTHIDDDHIGGMVSILSDDDTHAKIKAILFNGYKHLPTPVKGQSFGVKKAEELTALIEQRKIPWNELFNRDAVKVNDDGSARIVPLGANAALTILSPGVPELIDLRRDWDDGLVELERRSQAKAEKSRLRQTFGGINIAALAKKELYSMDRSSTNASSIAFLLNAGGSKILFAGDALAEVMCASWSSAGYDVQDIDIFKVSHHGSSKNTTEELLRLFPANRYVISTSGEGHSHPDSETLARIITYGKANPVFIFNYKNAITSVWSDESVSNYRHTSQYATNDEVIEIQL